MKQAWSRPNGWQIPFVTRMVTAAAGALLLAGCGMAPSSETASGEESRAVGKSEPSTPTPTPEPSIPGPASESPAAISATEDEAAPWTTYTDTSGRVSFQHPADWTVHIEPPVIDDYPDAINLLVARADGSFAAQLNTGKIYYGGAGCLPIESHPLPYTVLASVPMDIPSNNKGALAISPPRFVFRVLESHTGDGSLLGSYGITDHLGGPDGKGCMLTNFVWVGHSLDRYMFGDSIQLPQAGEMDGPPQKVFANMVEAQAYVATPEFQEIQRMITSLKVTP